MWNKLRNRQIGGFKFVRQEAIGPYFADFVCRERKLIVEVDGGTHSSEAEIAADVVRSKYLETSGYRLIRVWNS
ncbi:MAG: endonuclease domain-containing protein, partial [Hyphomicrobium sp.]